MASSTLQVGKLAHVDPFLRGQFSKLCRDNSGVYQSANRFPVSPESFSRCLVRVGRVVAKSGSRVLVAFSWCTAGFWAESDMFLPSLCRSYDEVVEVVS